MGLHLHMKCFHGSCIYSKTARFESPGTIGNSLKIQTCFFNQWVASSTHLLWDCWCIHDLKLWNLVSFLSFLLSGTLKWLHSESGQISVEREYFWIICTESNLIFYRKEIWSFLKVLHKQILEELINLRLKCSFLSLAQVIPRVQVTPFYGTLTILLIKFKI